MRGGIVLSDATATRLRNRLDTVPGAAAVRGRGAGGKGYAKAYYSGGDEVVIGPGSGSGGADAIGGVYPATVVDASALDGELTEGEPVWLTVWGAGLTPGAPVSGRVYAVEVSGDLDVDGDVRPRVFAVDAGGLPGAYLTGGFEYPSPGWTLLGCPVDVPAGSTVVAMSNPFVSVSVPGIGATYRVLIQIALGFAYWDAADPTPAVPAVQTPQTVSVDRSAAVGEDVELIIPTSVMSTFTVGAVGAQRIGLFYTVQRSAAAGYNLYARQIVIVPVAPLGGCADEGSGSGDDGASDGSGAPTDPGAGVGGGGDGPTTNCGRGVGSPDPILTVTGGVYAGTYTSPWQDGSPDYAYFTIGTLPDTRDVVLEFFGGQWMLLQAGPTLEYATGGTCSPFALEFAGTTIPGATLVEVSE